MFTRLVGLLFTGARPRSWLDMVGMLVLVASAACTTTMGRGPPGHFGYDTTVNAGCRHNPAACVSSPGEETAIFHTLQEVATAGGSVVAVLRALDSATQTAIEHALVRCADEARADVLLKHERQFRKAFPDADECRQMTVDGWGRKVTWSIRLGSEMHEEARKCAERVLGSLWPGGFSLEQLYRFDRRTGHKKLVSAEQEKLLVETGNGGELAGSLRPDVVLHSGDPLQPQAVYDFKFPCVNTDRIPPWSDYPSGHPYEDSTQGDMYEEAFGGNVARIAPRWGVIR